MNSAKKINQQGLHVSKAFPHQLSGESKIVLDPALQN